ncbi:MAG: ATP-grasp domain-containing protein [Melioribacteraceae bacterium]|nr:ATP-grasp domain-containing protein [Melioribacteraceae bacterium]
MLDKKVLICYNEPVSFYTNYIGKDSSSNEERVDLSETDFKKNLHFIQDSLQKSFSSVQSLGFTRDIKKVISLFQSSKPDLIFNFVESIEGDSDYESFVTGMFDIMQIPYTGNNSLSLGNCLNKRRTKQLLTFKGIKTPAFQVITIKDSIKPGFIKIKYPIITKLISEDASIGISENSVIYNFEELKKQCKFLSMNYKKDIILEEYIKGRELNISILGDEVLPISEITFNKLPKGLPKIVTYEAKWSPSSVYFNNSVPVCPAPLKAEVETRIKETAIAAYKALGCRDYARVDIRLNKNNVPYVIEVNPNPDISPDTGFVRSATAAGITYDDLLNRLAGFALKRNISDKSHQKI